MEFKPYIVASAENEEKYLLARTLFTLRGAFGDEWRERDDFIVGDPTFFSRMIPSKWRRVLVQLEEEGVFETVTKTMRKTFGLLVGGLSVVGFLALFTDTYSILLRDTALSTLISVAVFMSVSVTVGVWVFVWYMQYAWKWQEFEPQQTFMNNDEIKELSRDADKCFVLATFTTWKKQRTLCFITIYVSKCVVKKICLERVQ